MSRADEAPPSAAQLLRDSPSNWGRWGDADEVGALNFLGAREVLAATELIRTGAVFTLGMPIGVPGGEPVWPGRRPAERYMLLDESDYLAGNGPDIPGGWHYADDSISMSLQGSTQCDALGHVWYDDKLWNGFTAATTFGGLDKASVLPIAERGIVGRAVLLDIARMRAKPSLDKGELIELGDLLDCARSQGVELRQRDILVLRTGFLEPYRPQDKSSFYQDFNEPGLTYSPELVDWFHHMQIPCLATDTLGNEVTFDDKVGINMPLHCALMRNLGVVFIEICGLAALAAQCADDNRYDFFFAAAPLKVARATGGLVNPIVIK